MGIARTNGRESNHHQRLAVIAGELEPARAPFWVSQPADRTPSQGWWWTPSGLADPVYLGHNHVVAEIALRHTIDAHYKTAGV